MSDDVDQVDDGAPEETSIESDWGAAIEAWKNRDREAELAELAGDADAVAAMRKQLARLGVKAARNPFAIGTPVASEDAEPPAPPDWMDWQRYMPKPKTKG